MRKITALFILLLNMLLLTPSKALSADDFSPIINISPAEGNSSSEVNINLNKASAEMTIINLAPEDALLRIENATEKFVQGNIRASWADYKDLIVKTKPNDFVYIAIANKMADLGLFDLAMISCARTSDKNISALTIDDMKHYYFPRKKLKYEDELFLAEVYSNIIYNDQSSEATAELLKNTSLLSSSDYANYLVALGSHKSNFFSRANKYIDLAIMQNPASVNYKALKALILIDNEKPDEAIKTLAEIKKQNLYSYTYKRKIESLEQFILYKTSKYECEKNYHLGYYYYLENESGKAIRTLQSALASTKKKNIKAQILGLMSEIYLGINEFEKANDVAKKAHRLDYAEPKALISMGDLNYRSKNYKQALSYYKQAATRNKTSYIPLVKEAQAYQMLSNTKKAKEIYQKILKTRFDCWEAYYHIALLEKDKEEIYLKKALSVNLLCNDAWIQLARLEIDKANYNLAKEYLANAFYIDENDFRYYYYQGLVNKNLGNYSQAEYDFKKCLKLNPGFKEAQQEIEPASAI